MTRANKIAAGSMRSYTSPVPNVYPPPESMRPTLVGSNYMIAAGHPLVAHVAASVLDNGGTAIDAGVAAGLASNVVQADMCNLGGVAPILLRQAGSSKVWSISGVGPWSQSVTLEEYLRRHKGDMPLGAACCVVPAAADAWIATLSRFGTQSFTELAAPAIQLAERGFPLDLRAAQSFELMGTGFKHWPSSAKVYWPKGRPPRIGERIVQRDLALTLKTMADAERGSSRRKALENVRRSFYEGRIAERIATWVTRGGGWMTMADLADFRNEVVEADSFCYGDWEVFTGGIYCQGPVLLQALSILAQFNLRKHRHNSADYLHLLVEVMKLAFSDREKHYGDPRFTAVELADLLSPAHARSLARLIQKRATLPDLATTAAPVRRKKDTTYFSIIDSAGNAISSAPSDTIDGNPLVDGLGILVSPRGVQSRLDSGHPACLAPGKRPRLTPAPAIALKKRARGEPMIMAFGAPGGDVIPQAMLQAFLNHVEFGMLPQLSVEAARVTTLSFPDSFFPHVHDVGRLSVEARIPEATRNELADRGHMVHLWPDYEFDSAGAAMCVDLQWPGKEGRVLAAGVDVRRNQYAWGR